MAIVNSNDVNRLKAQLNEFLEPQAQYQAQGSGPRFRIQAQARSF
jgi:hypothetical protein